MVISRVRIEGRNIKDWDSFHDEFDRVFSFLTFYGRNMDAWIDCMSHLDDPEAAMTAIHVHPGTVLCIEVANAGDLKKRCPELLTALTECAAFVNWRRTEEDEPPVLALSFYA